jgi:hypothetical protein
VNTRVAGALLLSMTGVAAADGERTPMFGAAVTHTTAPDRAAELVGGALELAWWSGQLGLALEAAANRGIEDDSARNLAVGGSARVLVASWLWPSLFDDRDVEMGVELQAIAARTWWTRDASSDAVGLGVAIRMRGGSDWQFSSLLVESRLFVRVMTSRDAVPEAIARATRPMAEPPPRPGLTVLVGLGAAFGAGTPSYLERFRPQAFDAAF